MLGASPGMAPRVGSRGGSVPKRSTAPAPGPAVLTGGACLSDRCLASEAHVEVLFEGFAFRLFLTGDRDQAVLERQQQAQQAVQSMQQVQGRWAAVAPCCLS